MSKYKFSLILALFFQISWPGVTFSGNAAFRPRYEYKDFSNFPQGDTLKTSTDFYVFYRSRIRMIADIGDGWFLNAKLSANAPANYSRLGRGDKINDQFPDGSGRPSVYFMEMYWGFQKEKIGAWVGIVPVGAPHTPALDIHYYPKKIVNIPWILFNNSATSGFGGYCKVGDEKISWVLSYDTDVMNSEEPVGEEETSHIDNVTAIINYSLHIRGLDINPILLYTLGNKQDTAPITGGIQFTLPDLLPFKLSGNIYATHQGNKEAPDQKYDGWIFRGKTSGKIGPGNLTLWLDIAQLDWQEEYVHDFTFFWIHYLLPVYSSHTGSVTIRPTFRYMNESVAGMKDFSMYRFEITTEIQFR